MAKSGLKILVYPRSDKNPYQELLYVPMRVDRGATVTYLTGTRLNLVLLLFVLLRKRLEGYRVLHLHWPSFRVSYAIPKAKTLSYLLTRYCLLAIRLSGLRLVWTVHNAVPHEQETSDDVAIARQIARQAAAKIVHSRYALDEMQELGMSTARTEVIPHGNYRGVYPDTITPGAARARLGVAKDEFVLLFLGMIRPYKGVDDLLAAHAALGRPDVRLIIAGGCQDDTLRHQIEDAAAAHDNVTAALGFVPDEDVAMYFKAADVVCLPFKSVTTSGSALLALTFGKPLVAPRTGSLLDLPDDIGYFYDPDDTEGLSHAIEHACASRSRLAAQSKSVAAYARTLDWDKIAGRTYDLYVVVTKSAN